MTCLLRGKPRAAFHFLLPLAAIWAGGVARGDVVELVNGGRVEGTLVEDVQSDTSVVIETATGGRVAIPRAEVSQVVEASDTEIEYQQMARSAPDTVEAHWKLSEWCREHNLSDESQRHLARILELDPDHADARRLMGYRDVSGSWMTRDELMAARGLVEYDGKYRTRQHIELLEREKQFRKASSDWSNRLGRLRRWLTGRRQDRAEQAQDEILAIRDPLAAEAVVAMLRREDVYQIKQLWIDVAAQLEHPLAVDALVDLSLYDPDEHVRTECLEHLIKSERTGLATPYIRALRSNDNEIVNRAAAALGQIGDADAIAPLIEALITKHRFQAGSGSADQHAYSFSQNGGSFNFGGGPKVVTQTVKNPAVLSALVVLSGGTSFDYDQPQWRSWLAAQARLHRVDVRRDR